MSSSAFNARERGGLNPLEFEPLRPALRKVGENYSKNIRPGRLLGLLASGAVTPPREVRILRTAEPAAFPSVSFSVEHAFGQKFILSAVDGGDWGLTHVGPDGSETDMGLTRNLLGWRPTGAPLGGWK
jgi:hypothetical protein